MGEKGPNRESGPSPTWPSNLLRDEAVLVAGRLDEEPTDFVRVVHARDLGDLHAIDGGAFGSSR